MKARRTISASMKDNTSAVAASCLIGVSVWRSPLMRRLACGTVIWSLCITDWYCICDKICLISTACGCMWSVLQCKFVSSKVFESLAPRCSRKILRRRLSATASPTGSKISVFWRASLVYGISLGSSTRYKHLPHYVLMWAHRYKSLRPAVSIHQ